MKHPKNPPPKRRGRPPKPGITRHEWERLLAEYRLAPGAHAAVARATGLSAGTCTRYWSEGGRSSARPWAAEPIKDIVERELLALRAELQLDREAAERSTVMALGELDALRARADLLGERVSNVQLARVMKAQVLELSGMYQRVLEGVSGVAADGLVQIFAGERFKTLCLENPKEALKQVRELTKLGKELGEAAERAVKLERLLLGESTENKAVDVVHSFESKGDALLAIERAHKASLRARGIVIDVETRVTGSDAAE